MISLPQDGRESFLKIAPDTNVLVRATIHDDAVQTQLAIKALEAASLVAVTTASLCEFVWVLKSGYKEPGIAVATAIKNLLASDNVVADRLAIESGLMFLEAGSDFADGVIAYEGRQMGGEVFLTFDKAARRTANNNGIAVATP